MNNKDKYCLGIHIGHDRGASLIKDGILIGHIAHERIDRIKHSEFPEIPFESINKILKQCNISPNSLAAVGISFVNVEIKNFEPELKAIFCDYYKLNDIKFIGVEHHYAHALSSYYCSGFKEALLFVADGAGDVVGDKLESESVFLAHEGEILVKEKRLHSVDIDVSGKPFLYNYDLMSRADKGKEISIAKKYEQFTNLIGFGHFQDGKTMGLASYGRPLFDYSIETSNGLDFSLQCKSLLEEVHTLKQKSKLPYHKFVKTEKANLAKTVQCFIEKSLISIFNSLTRKYEFKCACLSGGLFLNCVANHKLVHHFKNKKFFIIPAAGDDGQSIGAAFEAYRLFCKNRFPKSRFSPYLGLSYSNHKIKRAINSFNLDSSQYKEKKLCKLIAEKISEGKVVGILKGRSEMGPRALCHRSILADPRKSYMKRHLNKYVKFREAFRPYAPVVTWEDQFKYFELCDTSPFMLLASKVKPKYRNVLKAITHIDGTARVQAIREDDDSLIHRILKNFESITGLPILLNTSFNLAGQPIVETPHDAITTFVSTGIDVLVIENYLILKHQNRDK